MKLGRGRCGIAGLLLGAATALAATSPATAQKLDEEAIGAVCVPTFGLDRPLSDLPVDERRRVVACLMREAARQIAAQAPIRVDDVTTLHSVVAEDLTMTYNYRLAIDPATLSDEAAAEMTRAIDAAICADRAMRNSVENGVVYVSMIGDVAGREMHRVRTDRC